MLKDLFNIENGYDPLISLADIQSATSDTTIIEWFDSQIPEDGSVHAQTLMQEAEETNFDIYVWCQDNFFDI